VARLHQSPRGSVCLAVDIQEARRCVLKHTYRDALLNHEGRDATDFTRHEAEILTRLAPDSRFPRMYDLLEPPVNHAGGNVGNRRLIPLSGTRPDGHSYRGNRASTGQSARAAAFSVPSGAMGRRASVSSSCTRLNWTFSQGPWKSPWARLGA